MQPHDGFYSGGVCRHLARWGKHRTCNTWLCDVGSHCSDDAGGVAQEYGMFLVECPHSIVEPCEFFDSLSYNKHCLEMYTQQDSIIEQRGHNMVPA